MTSPERYELVAHVTLGGVAQAAALAAIACECQRLGIRAGLDKPPQPHEWEDDKRFLESVAKLGGVVAVQAEAALAAEFMRWARKSQAEAMRP